MMETRKIATASIRESEDKLRPAQKDEQQYKDLAASVKNNYQSGGPGVLQNITVRIKKDEKLGVDYYELVDGLQRLSAAKDAGIPELTCNVHENMSDLDVLYNQIVLNIQRVDTKPVQYTRQLARILEINPMMTITELAKSISRSPTYIQERLGLLKLVPTAQELVDSGRIVVSNAFLLAKLPEEEQPNFIDRAMTATTQEFGPLVHTRIKQIREENRKGREAQPETFTPIAKARRLSELKEELEKPSEVRPVILADCKTPEDGFVMGLKYAQHLDPVSVKEQISKHEAQEKEREAKKAKLKKETEEKKQKEAAEQAALAAEAQRLATKK